MNRRTLLPAAVAVLALIAAVNPRIPGKQRLTDALVVVDITRSMNVRDMNGLSRLEFARRSLRDWIATRPCGSRIGLAIFTERRSLTLFEPVEICADFSSIAGSLAALDWRMAWDGDSLISRGLDYALTRATQLDVPVVFVTDGHEAPPRAGVDAFRGASPGGVVLGVGGETLAQIPKFDDFGRETGFYQQGNVQQAAVRRGVFPTYGEPPGSPHPNDRTGFGGNEHLSAMRASYLRTLADARKLGFLPLAHGPAAIERTLAANASSHVAAVSRSLAPFTAGIACALLTGLWLKGRSPAKTRGNSMDKSTRENIQ